MQKWRAQQDHIVVLCPVDLNFSVISCVNQSNDLDISQVSFSTNFQQLNKA